ncbi:MULTISPECIES: tripartite tricarboxylate transporter substrate binding protein [unclassified Variovorax]|jgi:tripartite-type tricarboxylate transporter receptor subunit TctC|uniref:Bug family tripartite tricarboxylate transporter substrate binding protein n=1 Tax=unclassified Variovorax TaxID=663243 RepID=UPI00086BD745|nr:MULTISPECIES: tripartite tricarboxylate transporter substrate binding protein [unclassified Variovorax]MBN8756574.1 tripartite tricarboxylate transporter substrate binding protein [Variovorax sp.]ODU18969.1 MAG: ABC transporter substrate-binding protein [Variovorax sp. SCN 67-85]ODV23618.1 MAG: ABC transporter substrate-binding protein [Variovorax sp. SCN 67-20]OJZ08234.1 MAG: ABC transporter substrate-binding protein [Variovorax sp. 67-131]
MNRREAIARLAAAAAATTASASLWAQDDKPITLVVPYSPGGTTDLLGRLLARGMAPLVGSTIIVENRPGAGSGLGAAYVAHAPADGRTLLIATSTTLAINPWLYKRLGYDPLKDFAPIGMIGSVPLVAVVNASLPVTSIAELVALSKAQPGKLSYGSAGNGSPQHLAVEMFKAATGADLTHVPYRGSALAMTDLLGGQIQLMFSDIPPALAHVRGGKLRALGVTSAKRQPAMPELATIGESGAVGTKDFQAIAWQSLVAPAGCPPELVAKYAAALEKVMKQPEIQSRLASEGVEPVTMGPQQLAAYMKSETVRWGAVVKASGATMD